MDPEGYKAGRYVSRLLRCPVWNAGSNLLSSISAAGQAQEPSALRKTFVYVTRGLNLVDFAAIFPFYLGLITGSSGLGFLRVLRLARVMRIFKLGKYSEGTALLYNTLGNSSSALMVLFFFIVIMVVVFGSLIFFFEQGKFKVTPDFPMGAYYRKSIRGVAEEISPFSSIPLSFYWTVITTTTVGVSLACRPHQRIVPSELRRECVCHSDSSVRWSPRPRWAAW
jgi:hypothetical protein